MVNVWKGEDQRGVMVCSAPPHSVQMPPLLELKELVEYCSEINFYF